MSDQVCNTMEGLGERALPTTDQLRGVIIALLDKCHQIEALLERLPIDASRDDLQATIRAYRHTVRSWLTILRDLDRGERRVSAAAGSPQATPPPGAAPPTSDGSSGVKPRSPTPARFQNWEMDHG
jgi:hypothetical protein